MTDDAAPPVEGRRPEVIVDFDVRDGLLFVSLKNIGDGSAYEVTTRFDPPFRGLGGKKDIAGMQVFRRAEFLPPGKAFVQFVDPLAVYMSRQEPARLSATIAYRDRQGRPYTDVITHDLRVYLDLGDVVARPPARSSDPLP